MRLFKTAVFFLSVLLISGCTTINIPSYIKDKNPYKRRFDSPFDKVISVTKETLKENGWVIVSVADPAVYEHLRRMDLSKGKQSLLITQVREMALFIGSRYARMNVFIKTGPQDTTELEMRYVTVTSVPLKTFYSYRKDGFVGKLFDRIQQKLGEQ